MDYVNRVLRDDNIVFHSKKELVVTSVSKGLCGPVFAKDVLILTNGTDEFVCPDDSINSCYKDITAELNVVDFMHTAVIDVNNIPGDEVSSIFASFVDECINICRRKVTPFTIVSSDSNVKNRNTLVVDSIGYWERASVYLETVKNDDNVELYIHVDLEGKLFLNRIPHIADETVDQIHDAATVQPTFYLLSESGASQARIMDFDLRLKLKR